MTSALFTSLNLPLQKKMNRGELCATSGGSLLHQTCFMHFYLLKQTFLKTFYNCTVPMVHHVELCGEGVMGLCNTSALFPT